MRHALALATTLLCFTAPALADPGEAAFDPSGYTVQLIALPSAERLEAFVRDRGVADLIATEVSRDGKPHFVLLLGVYPDRASASEAAADLPEALSDLRPWVRPMQSLLAAAR